MSPYVKRTVTDAGGSKSSARQRGADLIPSSITRPVNVLFIEGAEDDLEAIVHELNGAGIEFYSECHISLPAVGAALVRRAWDVIITDYKLAALTAEEVLSLMRVSAQDVPVIVVSGHIGEDEAVSLMKQGATDFVSKADLSALVPALARALEEAESHREEREAMEAIRKQERFLRELASGMGEGLLALDSDWKLVFMNPEAERILGWRRDELHGKRMHEVVHYLKADGSPFPASECPCTMVASGSSRHQVEDDHYIRKDGTFVPVSYTVTRTSDANGERRYVVVFRDRTEQKRAEQELRESRRQLRELTAFLQRIREEERTAIARELHDELGQMLSGLRMDAEWLQRNCTEQPKIAAKAKAMTALIDSSLRTVRRISTDLRPAVLDDLGLEAALEWLIGGFKNRSGIDCRVRLALDESRLVEDVAITVFRLVQESLTNVSRYAQAGRVAVAVAMDAERIKVEVRDDGVGFNVDAPKPRSYGVLGMRERVIALQGNFDIDSRPGDGTCVFADIPLARGVKQALD